MSQAKTATPVEAFQTRRDPDPRTEGKRTVFFESVDGVFAYIINAAGRRTRIATKALARWPLVTP